MSLSKLKKKIGKRKNKQNKAKVAKAQSAKMAVDFNPVVSQKAESAKSASRFNFVPSLYENDGELLSQALSLFPLVVGSWVSGGIAMHNPESFVMLMSVMILGHYLILIFKERLFIKYSQKILIYTTTAALALAVALGAYTGNILFGCLTFVFYILQIQEVYLSADKIPSFFLRLFCLISRMSLLSVLGAYCQLQTFIPLAAIFGFVPSCYLAAAEVALHKDLFLAHGWKKIRFATKANTSKSFKRPGSLTQLFVMLLIMGPLISILCVPLRILPDQMLITVIPLYFMPNVATGFFEENKNKRIIAISCLHHALLATILVLVAGLI